MNKILKSNRGSTSILVVIFMIVLMIFGLSILTTAISNTRLAEKKREWLTDYYKLEAEVASELAEIDKLLNDIKSETQITYTENSSGEEAELSVIYYNNVMNKLTDLGYMVYDTDSMDDTNLLLFFDLQEKAGEIPKHISVELEILMPDDEVDNGSFLEMTNYEIMSHTEWQDPFEYKESIKFEDPFDNPESQ